MAKRRGARQGLGQSPVTAFALATSSQLVWPSVDPDLLKLLPPVMKGVIKALGYSRGRVFLEQHGGGPVSLPKTRATSTLGLLEDELMRLNVALEPHIPTTRLITLPKADKLYLHVRNEQVMRDRVKMSLREAAKRHGITTRQVLNIQNEFEDGLSLSSKELQPLLC